jgi:hypothetical protein
MEQVWNIVVACLRRYSSKVSKPRHHPLALGEFSYGKFPLGFWHGKLMEESRIKRKISFLCL